MRPNEWTLYRFGIAMALVGAAAMYTRHLMAAYGITDETLARIMAEGDLRRAGNG